MRRIKKKGNKVKTKPLPMEIKKKVRQVTGTSEGVTFTKEDKEILDVKKDDIVSVRKEQ